MIADIDDFIHAHGWASETRDRYRRALLRADTLQLDTLTPNQFIAYLEAQHWGTSTRWVNYCAIRQYLKWRYGAAHPALTLKIRRKKAGTQRVLEADQVSLLLASFDTSTDFGTRDLAMCALFLDSGLRVSEVARLELAKVDLRRCRLSVVVKRGNEAGGIFSAYTATLLANWLVCRPRFAHPGVKQLFVGIGGSTPGDRMTRSGIQRCVLNWGKKIKEIGQLSPHDFRRTFATISTRAGCPQRILMEAGRWESPEMIQRYTESIRQEDFEQYSPVMAIMTGTVTKRRTI